MIRREYKVSSRNGYYAVDEFLNGKCYTNIDSGMTKRNAESLKHALECVINQYEMDNKLGKFAE